MEEKNWCYGSIQYKGLTESGWRGEAGICQEGKGGGPSGQTQSPAVTLIGICAHYLHRLTNASWLVLRQPLSIRRCCACSSKAGKQVLGDELAGKGDVREAGRTE